MKIAVIGSGITGLAASWYLSDKHEVTLFERGHRVGMDAHSVAVDTPTGPVHVNVPMRVFFEGYYPYLTELYRQAGIAFEPVNYAASFTHLGGDTYFRYTNLWAGRHSLPMLAGKSLTQPQAVKLGMEVVKFLRDAKKHGLRNKFADQITLAEWLELHGYSKRFAEKFVYPAFAGICTCDYQSVADYPASIILGYLASDLVGSKVNRLTNGVHEVTERLAASASEIRYRSKLAGLREKNGAVQLLHQDGSTESFDHVVISTQANQALSLLLEPRLEEQQVLAAFRYESGRIVVHRDERLAPDNRKEWAPVNFLLSDSAPRPMASIWLNRIYPALSGQPNVFESWNPLIEPGKDTVLIDAAVERPVVTAASLRAIEKLQGLHQEEGRRIWFCGSYSRRGIPLLENAVASAADVAVVLNEKRLP